MWVRVTENNYYDTVTNEGVYFSMPEYQSAMGYTDAYIQQHFGVSGDSYRASWQALKDTLGGAVDQSPVGWAAYYEMRGEAYSVPPSSIPQLTPPAPGASAGGVPIPVDTGAAPISWAVIAGMGLLWLVSNRKMG